MITAGIFVFIALSFLLGLAYGCCGRRPESSSDDDCCVKTTGGKFYSWFVVVFLLLHTMIATSYMIFHADSDYSGICTCLLFMNLFGLITAALAFIGSNASNLACLPVEDPLSRPDMLSVGKFPPPPRKQNDEKKRLADRSTSQHIWLE